MGAQRDGGWFEGSPRGGSPAFKQTREVRPGLLSLLNMLGICPSYILAPEQVFTSRDLQLQCAKLVDLEFLSDPCFFAGDWMCPDCNAHNFASKMSCYRCQLPRCDPKSSEATAMRTLNSKQNHFLLWSRVGSARSELKPL